MSTNQPPPTELNDQMISIAPCQRLFQFPPHHEWQSDVIRSLIQAHRQTTVTNMLVIRPTGGGKSLIYYVDGYLGGKVSRLNNLRSMHF